MTSPRVAVVVSHPVQYFTPLFQRLTDRGNIELTVFYGNDAGARPSFDAGFGREFAWDVDLLVGHRHVFLTTGPHPLGAVTPSAIMTLARSLWRQDVVVIHGYATPLTATALLFCLVTGTPYLLRSDTTTVRKRRWFDPRTWWIKAVVRGAAGVLSSGTKNGAIFAALGARRLFPAPFTVDVERFRRKADQARQHRGARRTQLGIPENASVVVFAGKMAQHKRPGDLATALLLLGEQVHGLFIGDGPLTEEVREAVGDRGTVMGFANQSEMPALLASGDVFVLPSEREAWGLAVNEALACGLVPVVSSAVGCAPDLVVGNGEVYPVGDVPALAAAVERALHQAVRHPESVAQSRKRFLREYSLDATARGYEVAVQALCDEGSSTSGAP